MARDHWILLVVLGCALLLAALDLARFDADPIEAAVPVAFRDEPHATPVGPLLP